MTTTGSLWKFRPLIWWRHFVRPVKAARYYAGLLVRIEQLCVMWMDDDDLPGRPKNPAAKARAQMVASYAAKWRNL